MTQTTAHLGKNGLTDNFINSLRNAFKNHDNVKISVLKSACRDKQKLNKIADDILAALGKRYTAKAVGYKISLKKWRKEKR